MKQDGDIRLPVFPSDEVAGDVVNGTFVPRSSRNKYDIGFKVPSSSAYCIIVSDESMCPVLGCGDLVVMCPEAQLAPGSVVVAKIRDRDGSVLAYYRPASLRTFLLFTGDDNSAPLEVDESDIEWIHTTVAIVPHSPETRKPRGRRADA